MTLLPNFPHDLTGGALLAVEPLRWTQSGRIQMRRWRTEGGRRVGAFFAVTVFELAAMVGRKEATRIAATLPEQVAA